jgi:phenylalanyl-tRNA synthetase beta chain
MRTSLIPGMLETMGRNNAQQIKTLRMFEIGRIYLGRGPDRLPQEMEVLAGLWTGARTEAAWLSKEESVDFYDVKGAVESLFAALKIDDPFFTAPAEGHCTYMRPGHSAEVRLQGRPVGFVGEVHPAVRKAYELRQTAFVFDLDLEFLGERIPESVAYRPVPKFPAVPRDMTLIIDKGLEAGGLLEHIRRMAEPLVESVSLFDVFTQPPIPPGKKSVSIRVTYRSGEKTLEESEVGRVHHSITERLVTAYGADLPG